MSRLLNLAISVLIISTLVPCTAIAKKKFVNSYVEFDLPDSWQCNQEGGQHVCQPINPDQRKEAIIVMASKYKGPDDDIKQYQAKLEQKRKVKDIKGKEYDSKKQYLRSTFIQGTMWLDSQHENSEVPGFITRYLATVAKGLGMVLTFSAHKSKFNAYTADFYTMINSLRVRNDIPAEPIEGGTDLSKFGSGVAFGPDGKKLADGKAKGLQIDMTGAKDNTIIYLVAGLVVLVAVYLVIRRRNKRRKK